MGIRWTLSSSPLLPIIASGTISSQHGLFATEVLISKTIIRQEWLTGRLQMWSCGDETFDLTNFIEESSGASTGPLLLDLRLLDLYLTDRRNLGHRYPLERGGLIERSVSSSISSKADEVLNNTYVTHKINTIRKELGYLRIALQVHN